MLVLVQSVCLRVHRTLDTDQTLPVSSIPEMGFEFNVAYTASIR